MAVVNPAFGKMKGKYAGAVYAVVNGQQTMREKPASVKNPQTEAQVEQRSKMKLVTQLAACIYPSIFFKAEGAVSGRNKFVKANIKQTYFSAGKAAIILDNVQLADGNGGIPSLYVVRRENDKLKITFTEEVDHNIIGVYFCVYKKTDENRLALYGQKLVSNRDSNGDFVGEFPTSNDELVIWAVGVKATNSSAQAKYYEFAVSANTDTASLLSDLINKESGMSFTGTRGVTLYKNESESESVDDGEARVYVTAGAGGTATGAGKYAIGEDVTVTATPNAGFNFVGWRDAQTNTIITTQNPYTFQLEAMTDLIAIFEAVQPGQDTDD